MTVIDDNDIPVDDIARVKVQVFHEGWRLSQRIPRSTEEAQFSIKWPLATLLLDGAIGPAQVLEQRFDDEAVKRLVDKIEIVQDPEIDRMYQLNWRGVDSPDARFASRVEITLASGQVLDSGIKDRASIQWDDASLEEKFRWVTGYVLDEARVDAIVESAWELENLESVKQLTQLLR